MGGAGGGEVRGVERRGGGGLGRSGGRTGGAAAGVRRGVPGGGGSSHPRDLKLIASERDQTIMEPRIENHLIHALG